MKEYDFVRMQKNHLLSRKYHFQLIVNECRE
jgi:hypothetical protein